MDKVALITGAAGGIGHEFSKILAKEKYTLMLVDLDEKGLETKKFELENEFQAVVYTFAQDLSDTEAALKIVDWTKSLNLNVTLLFNNAGFGNFGYFKETNWGKDHAMLNVHMVTSTHLVKLLLPSMLELNQGYILNNASVAAFVPGPLMSTYHASKSYLLSFSQALANELKDSNVNVTVLCPGMTRTGFAKANGNDDPNIKFNVASADEVAAYAYKQLMKGNPVAVPGFFNKLSAFLPRFLPRKTVANMVGNIQRKNHANRKDQKAAK